MIDMIKTLCRLLEAGEDAVLATVVGHTGSTPRRAGSKMIVRRDGTIVGTIGGGIVEAEVMKAAPSVFEGRGTLIRDFDLQVGRKIESLDSLCGGQMTILMEWVHADSDTLQLYRHVREVLKTGEKSVLAGILPEGGSTDAPIARCLITGNRVLPETANIRDEVVNALRRSTKGQRAPGLMDLAGAQWLVEPVFNSGTVYIFGAGHVSLQLAQLTHRVDFNTVVLDDRAEFANAERFQSADEVIVLDRFESAFEMIAVNSDSYIVIVTRGHSHDKTVLEQALKSDAGYIGMIGSRLKRDAIYSALQKEGFSRGDLKRVHSPIGLKIEAETPEEIAVSIVAELIAVRAG